VRRLAPLIIAVAAIAVLSACKDSNKSNSNTPVATLPATEATQVVPTAGGPTATAIIALETTQSPAEAKFSQTPVSEHGVATSNTTVTLATEGTFDEYDRMTFQFSDGIPDYSVKYLDGPPTDCASGQTEQMQGAAFLEIRLSPAVAHDASGNPSVTSRDISANLPSLLEAKQTCDSEGVVTWVLGLTSRVDFRPFHIQDLLVVDVDHP
jgi:hypothetical protein